MVQVVQQTRQEKQEMYQLLSKEQLIDMLIESNEHLEMLVIEPYIYNPCCHKYVRADMYWEKCTNCGDIKPLTS